MGVQAAFGPMMAAQREQMQQAMRAEHQAQLTKLQTEIEAAKDEEEKNRAPGPAQNVASSTGSRDS